MKTTATKLAKTSRWEPRLVHWMKMALIVVLPRWAQHRVGLIKPHQFDTELFPGGEV